MILEADLYEFLWKFNRTDLYAYFLDHIRLGTALIYINDNRIVAAVRWNLLKSGRVAKIEDLFILPHQDSIKIMRYFGQKGHERFPSAKYIKFDREFKPNKRTSLVYKVSSLTKE